MPRPNAGPKRSTSTLVAAVAAGLALMGAGCSSSRTASSPGEDSAAPAPALEDQIGQLLLVGGRGASVERGGELWRLVCEDRVGALLLSDDDSSRRSARNIRSRAQLTALTAQVQQAAADCGREPVLLAADVEGGLVNRLRKVAGLKRVPSHRALGRGPPEATRAEARRVGRVMAAAGVRWNLAPVVDVDLNPDNPIIGRLGRSFSSAPGRVAAHADAFLAGLRDAGVAGCLKHYPGHGSSRADTHKGVVDVTETARLEVELEPYRQLIAAGSARCVMTAHLINHQVDEARPMSLSPVAIERILRGRLGFDGLVVSDDLQMGAIKASYSLEEAAVMAIEAGTDVLTLSNDVRPDGSRAVPRVRAALLDAVAGGRLPASRIVQAAERVAAFRARVLGGRRPAD